MREIAPKVELAPNKYDREPNLVNPAIADTTMLNRSHAKK
jgi:hypothetical protein